jgi:hypothetical protein
METDAASPGYEPRKPFGFRISPQPLRRESKNSLISDQSPKWGQTLRECHDSLSSLAPSGASLMTCLTCAARNGRRQGEALIRLWGSDPMGVSNH